MRFEPSSRTIELSVRELSEGIQSYRGFDRGDSWNRFGLGLEIHADARARRLAAHPQYRAEVPVSATLTVRGYTIHVTGRLDGCLQNESGAWHIEEFKSAHFSSRDLIANPLSERHRQQLLIYCHLWYALGHHDISAALVYVDILTGRECSIAISYDAPAYELEFLRRIGDLVDLHESAERARAVKALAAQSLPFPHSQPRPGQQNLMEAVGIAVQQGEHLIAEAPTGSGKTAAGIYPALAHSLQAGRQLVFLTAKTLQQTMAVRALQPMNTSRAFHTLQLRSKERMCANGEVLCHEDFCPYAKNYPQKMERSQIIDRLRAAHSHHDPEVVFAEAKKEEVCPFEVQLELAAKADALVADYNYVFDPGVALQQFEELQNVTLIVDEAHNLPDRVRQIYSPELLETTFRAASDFLTRNGAAESKPSRIRATVKKQKVFDFSVQEEPECFALLDQCLSTANDLLAACANSLPAGVTIVQIEPPQNELRALWKKWERAFIAYLAWKREHKIVMAEDPVVAAHFELHRFLAVLALFSPAYRCVIERTPAGLRLAILCLDPSQPLAPTFRSLGSAILLSATLKPEAMIRRVTGLEPARTAAVSLPPPFPKEHRKILILPQIKTSFATRTKSIPTIGRMIAEMSAAVPGNVLVLFPSYNFLTQVLAVLPPNNHRVVAQKPGAAANDEILKALLAASDTPVLAFAVMGGMYAEGLDYPDQLLSGVFIVSPGLPQLSFERNLLREYFDDQEQAGFEYAYVQPGLTRVIQAAGRLIRSEKDRGVIALMCERFLREPYVSLLPKDWYSDSPLELVSSDPVQSIQDFFAST